MNLERSSPGHLSPAPRHATLSPVDGTHNLRVASTPASMPHTDESVSADALPPMRTPLKQGALLLAIYVAMYGTVGALVNVAHALAAELRPTFAPVRDDTMRPSGRDERFASIDGDFGCAPA
jgi:hypothetical protein